MDHRLEQCRRDAKGQHVLGVAVNDSVDLRARFVGRTMDVALNVERTVVGVDRAAVEVELDDIASVHQLGAARAGQQIAVRIGRMADADVAAGIDHVLVGEDAVGNYEFVYGLIKVAHAFSACPGLALLKSWRGRS